MALEGSKCSPFWEFFFYLGIKDLSCLFFWPEGTNFQNNTFLLHRRPSFSRPSSSLQQSAPLRIAQQHEDLPAAATAAALRPSHTGCATNKRERKCEILGCKMDGTLQKFRLRPLLQSRDREAGFSLPHGVETAPRYSRVSVQGSFADSSASPEKTGQQQQLTNEPN